MGATPHVEQGAQNMPVAIVTGASQGLGLALTRALATSGWSVVVDARDATALTAAIQDIPYVTAIPGDVTDPLHRAALIGAARHHGGLDLLVNNASRLGPSPQPPLATYPLPELRRVYEADVVAPLALAQLALEAGVTTIVNVTSDAAVEPYEGWGGYGSAKAALDQLTRILGAEQPDQRVYAFDPGDMRTAMHQAAFPGEDITDRPAPEDTAVPALLRLLDDTPPSGRYRAVDLAPVHVS
jgi:NAD(P)-dependent dehydrogenase (short-subunit alcohol dehydrogenase family)